MYAAVDISKKRKDRSIFNEGEVADLVVPIEVLDSNLSSAVPVANVSASSEEENKCEQKRPQKTRVLPFQV